MSETPNVGRDKKYSPKSLLESPFAMVLLHCAGLPHHTCQQASALARLVQLGVFDRAERAEREGLLSELSEREDGRSLGQLARLG